MGFVGARWNQVRKGIQLRCGFKSTGSYHLELLSALMARRRKGPGLSWPWLVDGFIPSAFREGKVELRMESLSEAEIRKR